MKRPAIIAPWVILLIGMAIGALPASVTCAAGSEPPASAGTDEIAVVAATQNDTKVQRAGEANFKKIDRGTPLFVMDFLSTGRNSKLWWDGSTDNSAWSPFPTVTQGSLGEHTVFGFAGFETNGPAISFIGQLNTGIIRLLKNLPPTEPPSTFAIITPTARIEVIPTDRAADYIVETEKESRTTVTVLWGKVRVRNVAKQFEEERILTSCQEVDVEKDKEPGPIRWVSTDTMTNLIKRTTIPKTMPTDVPSCERLKTEVILRPGKVSIPPPGVVLVPVPVPLPPGGKEKCPCPPGSYMNPETHQCSCCPPGKLYRSDTCSCECPCPRGEQYDPQSQRCMPCREGAKFDRETCRCTCPCPPGQILLPGKGCVQQCPEGFAPSYDTSAAVPHRCPVCVRQPEPVPGVPVTPQCNEDKPCGLCESCVDGTCVRKTCPEGMVLNRLNCECQPLISRNPTDCKGDGDCPACQKCRDGKCKATITCSQRERLNLQTCKCEPLNVESVTGTGQPTGGCNSNEECGSGKVCRNGKCVKRTPQPTPKAESSDDDTTDFPPEFGSIDTPRTYGPGFHINIGGGGGRHGGGGSNPKRGRGN